MSLRTPYLMCIKGVLRTLHCVQYCTVHQLFHDKKYYGWRIGGVLGPPGPPLGYAHVLAPFPSYCALLVKYLLSTEFLSFLNTFLWGESLRLRNFVSENYYFKLETAPYRNQMERNVFRCLKPCIGVAYSLTDRRTNRWHSNSAL